MRPPERRLPFGYRDRDGAVEPDPADASVIRLVFELFALHRRKKTVARMLTAAGHRTRRGAAFSASAVGRILRAPYAPSSAADGAAMFPALIPLDLWRTCKDILDALEDGQSSLSRRPVHPFAGTLECTCGGRMYVPSNSPKYVCRDCRNKIPIDDLDGLFRDQLEGPLGEAWSQLRTDDKTTVVENVAQRIVVGDGSVTFEIRYLPFPSEIVATGERNGPDRNAEDNSNPAHNLIDQVLTVFQTEGVDRMFSSDLGNALGGMKQRELATALRPLGIRPQNIRVGKTVKKGYLAEWFSLPPNTPDADFRPDQPGESHEY